MSLKKKQGLIGKFRVERLVPSTRGIDHTNCRYFVLDPEHDPIARDALWAYALAAKADGYEALSEDLKDWLESLESE